MGRRKKPAPPTMPVAPEAAVPSNDGAAVLATGKTEEPEPKKDAIEPQLTIAQKQTAELRKRRAEAASDKDQLYRVMPGTWLANKTRAETMTALEIERHGRNLRSLLKHKIVEAI